MLNRIGEERTAVVCPEIDSIDAHTLKYRGVGGAGVGGFWWSLHFSWRPISKREQLRRKTKTEPIRYLRDTLIISASFTQFIVMYTIFFIGYVYPYKCTISL